MNQIPVGERILEERSRNRFTQEELARRLGVSKAAVSKWECGQSMPDIALLPKIASLFSITLAGLQSLALADLEQLAALAEGIWLPSGFEAVAPTLAPFVRIAFVTRLVESGETERAMDELERFARDLEKCCKTFESPQNPPLFQAVDDLLWQEGGEEAQAARSEAAASLRSALVGGVVSSESWAPLRGNPRYESLIRQMADGEGSL